MTTFPWLFLYKTCQGRLCFRYSHYQPSSGDSSEIYAEVVKGLGETLVGAYPGRAMSFVCKKDDLNSPKVKLSANIC